MTKAGSGPEGFLFWLAGNGPVGKLRRQLFWIELTEVDPLFWFDVSDVKLEMLAFGLPSTSLVQSKCTLSGPVTLPTKVLPSIYLLMFERPNFSRNRMNRHASSSCWHWRNQNNMFQLDGKLTTKNDLGFRNLLDVWGSDTKHSNTQVPSCLILPLLSVRWRFSKSGRRGTALGVVVADFIDFQRIFCRFCFSEISLDDATEVTSWNILVGYWTAEVHEGLFIVLFNCSPKPAEKFNQILSRIFPHSEKRFWLAPEFAL